ncbi:restriction endonuclease subunit S [Rudaea sp.]|uniref:restriction endonuclease subunit S n=1 Tax=Rudaea sp. TaxID=2136325 RepID=UPI0032201F7F
MTWPVMPIKSVAQVVTGNTPPKSNEENYGADFPWVKPPELGETVPIVSTAESLSVRGAKQARLLPKDAVMVCCIGSIGRVGIAGTELATNQQINSVICGGELNPRFAMYWFMRSTEMLTAAANSAVVPILNKGNFEKLGVPLPPLSEQHRIVELLDQADAMRRLRREADAKAARILPMLFEKAFGNPFEARWHSLPLGEVVTSMRNGTTADQNTLGKGYPVTRIETISAGVINLRRVRHVDLTEEQAERWRLQKGDILFSHINSETHIGKTAIYEGEPTNLLHGMNLLLLRPDSEKVAPAYLFAVLNSPEVRAYYRSRCKRAVNQASLNQKDISSLPVPVPPMGLQQKFSSSVGRFNAIFGNERVSTERLEDLFDVLLKKAFSGQLTAKWRQAHMQELLVEMQQQAKALNLPMPKEIAA